MGKINSKWIKDKSVKWKAIKQKEGNMGRTLFDINQGGIFLYPSPRVIEIKRKINKWDLIKLKGFCTAWKTINKTRLPAE